MSLSRQIEQDYIVAYKAGDAVRLNVLRHVKTAAKNVQVSLMRQLEESDFLDVILRQVKQRHDSIEQFTKAGRTDLAIREQAELDVLLGYMPKPLTDAEISEVIDEAVTQTGAQSVQEMGRVMNAILALHKGRLDAKNVSALVRERLSGK